MNLKPYIILESDRIVMFVEKTERNHPESRGFARYKRLQTWESHGFKELDACYFLQMCEFYRIRILI